MEGLRGWRGAGFKVEARLFQMKRRTWAGVTFAGMDARQAHLAARGSLPRWAQAGGAGMTNKYWLFALLANPGTDYFSDSLDRGSSPIRRSSIPMKARIYPRMISPVSTASKAPPGTVFN